ncbi:MAG TPA: phosphate ABC transporter permease PstA, partial [Acidimicrobiales bacterium]|nr:phosphate ABC transporter permease PstA [Acidimicrobiales bacterium]
MSLDMAPRVVATASRRERLKAAGFKGVLVVSLAVGLVSLAVLLIDTVFTGAPRLNMDLLRRFPSGRPANAGAQSAIMGTVWVVGICGLVTVPVGVGAAIYLEEYADPTRWYNRLLEVNIQNLAAVPAIVYGILGLGFLVRGIGLGQVVLAAALTLSLLVLPIVIIASRQAIRAVPNSIRLGSLALGATRWQTIRRQVLPAAVPGIATGSILALSRAIGEAAPL